jgi:hypothetical protein
VDEEFRQRVLAWGVPTFQHPPRASEDLRHGGDHDQAQFEPEVKVGRLHTDKVQVGRDSRPVDTAPNALTELEADHYSCIDADLAGGEGAACRRRRPASVLDHILCHAAVPSAAPPRIVGGPPPCRILLDRVRLTHFLAQLTGQGVGPLARRLDGQMAVLRLIYRTLPDAHQFAATVKRETTAWGPGARALW